MSYAPIDNIWAELCEPLILEQYKESPNLLALIKAFVGSGQGAGFENVGQSFETAINRLRSIYDIDAATGPVLDLLGGIRNVNRTPGESDADYKARIIDDLGVENSGTPNFLIFRAQKKSADQTPQYLEESQTDAPTAFIYTPNGQQLERAFVSRNTPAGVSGFPGAAICFADGSAMMDAGGKKFLAVADDSEIGNDKQQILITETGEILTTETGDYIITEGEV